MSLSLLMAAALPWISFDIRPNATIKSDNQASHDLERMQSVFGPDDNDLIVMVEGESLLEPDSLTALRDFRDQLQSLPYVKHVASIFDLKRPKRISPLIPAYVTASFDAEKLRADLVGHPIAAGQMISDDGRIIVFAVRIEGGSLPVSSIARVIDPLEVRARDLEKATSAVVRIAGHPAIRADVLISLQRAMIIGCTAAVIVSFIVSMFLFRALVPVMTVVAAPGLGVLWTFGLMTWCGEAIGGLMTALPNLIFVIGLTDAVHVMLEAQRQHRGGATLEQSVKRSLHHVGPACLLTSLTTFIGFGSLLLSRTESVQAFGLWAAIGTLLVLIAVICALPIIILCTPASLPSGRANSSDRVAVWLGWLVEPTLRAPRITTAVGVLLCLALLPPAVSQQPDIIWTEAIPDHSTSVVAMRRADERLGGALVAYVMIRWPEEESFPSRRSLNVLAKTQAMLREAPKFNGIFSILNILAVAPGQRLEDRYRNIRNSSEIEMNPVLNEDERMLVVSARVPNDGAAALSRRLDAIELALQQLAQEYPGFEFTVTGTVVAASRNMNAIIIDFARSLAMAAILIFLVFVIAFRSIVMGCLSVVPNVLPLLVTAAAVSLSGLPLQITSALTFSLCLGLAVDDTIHVLIRYRSIRREEPSASKAIRRTISYVGPALVMTTLILLGGFGALMTNPLPSVRLFAMLCGVTLVTALVGDLLLFPAMLLAASRRENYHFRPDCHELQKSTNNGR